MRRWRLLLNVHNEIVAFVFEFVWLFVILWVVAWSRGIDIYYSLGLSDFVTWVNISRLIQLTSSIAVLIFIIVYHLFLCPFVASHIHRICQLTISRIITLGSIVIKFGTFSHVRSICHHAHMLRPHRGHSHHALTSNMIWLTRGLLSFLLMLSWHHYILLLQVHLSMLIWLRCISPWCRNWISLAVLFLICALLHILWIVWPPLLPLEILLLLWLQFILAL